MAIKVKHDVNAAPMAVASAAGGKARRAMETARLIQNQRTQTLQGAHASPISPGQSHAPTLQAHAPTPVNWELQRRENAAQEAARAALADQNNAAAKERAQMGIDADADKLKAQQAFTKTQTEAERAWREKQTQQQQDFATKQEAARRDAAQKEWDRQHGILRQERDADLIAAGTHEYGYSPEAQREYDRIVKEYNDGRGTRFKVGSPEDEQFMAERDRQIAALPKTLVQRKDPEGLFRNNTFTDEQGRIFTTDGKLMYNPADAETRRMEFQQRQMDTMRSAADRLYTELKKPRKITHMVDDGYGETKPEAMFEERSDDEVMRIMQERYPQLFPAPPPSPFQQALQNWLKAPLGTGAQPAAQPAPGTAQAQAREPAQRPAAQGLTTLPQVFTPEQAADYKSQFRRR